MSVYAVAMLITLVLTVGTGVLALILHRTRFPSGRGIYLDGRR